MGSWLVRLLRRLVARRRVDNLHRRRFLVRRLVAKFRHHNGAG
jgi:hypothetical protein